MKVLTYVEVQHFTHLDIPHLLPKQVSGLNIYSLCSFHIGLSDHTAKEVHDFDCIFTRKMVQ